MIRYTSDPKTNLDIFLRTYAIPDKTFNFMSDATLSGAPDQELEKQPGMMPYTALRLPEWDPYKVLQNSYLGPLNNQEIIDKGEGLIDVPYQTKLQQDKIAAENPERLKQIALIEQELERLDIEEAKYNQQRQAKRDYYNSDAFLAKVYSLDPKTAEFFAGRRDAQVKKELEEADITNKYNIANLRLGDVSKKDKLELQQLWKDNTRALESAKTRGDTKAIIDEYQNNIDRIVAQLQVIDPVTWGQPKGTAAVSGTETTTTTKTEDDVKLQTAIEEGDKLIASAVDIKPKDGVIDNISDIQNTIEDFRTKYGISKVDVDKLLKKLENKSSEISAKFSAEKDAEALQYEKDKAALDNKINGWKDAVSYWKSIRSKAISAIKSYNLQNWGAGQTITMKALLGDALSDNERGVMSGKGWKELVTTGLLSKTGMATPVTKEQAEKVLLSLIDFVNTLLDDFRGLKDNKYVLNGLGLDANMMIPLTLGTTGSGSNPAGTTKTTGTATTIGKVGKFTVKKRGN